MPKTSDGESPVAAANKAQNAQLRRLLDFKDTDAGNAEAFELLYGDRFRYDRTKGKWLVWNGHYWAEDLTGEAERKSLITCRTRLSAVLCLPSGKDRDARLRWALKSESLWGREALLKSARSVQSFATTIDQYDCDAYLLTTQNGTIDLRTGKLKLSRRVDLITRTVNVLYNPDVRPHRWIRFLDEVFGGDHELIEYIRRAVGYSLTGDTREQCFFILFGTGANGKSTFIEIICKLLGTHAETAEFSTFLVRKDRGAPRNDVAKLHAARLVKASESQHMASIDEALIKEVTGEDTISARFLYREHFSFKPKFKIWLITNHKPEIRGTDPAIWRRVRLIPFSQQFEGPQRDPTLRKKLESELPGILAWAVEGCLSWQRQGLGEAPRVTQATLEYRQESDPIGRFLQDCCTQESRSTVPAGKLYGAYRNWCPEQSEKAVANNVFARGLATRGIAKTRTRKGVVYKGVALSPTAAVQAPAPPPTGDTSR